MFVIVCVCLCLRCEYFSTKIVDDCILRGRRIFFSFLFGIADVLMFLLWENTSIIIWVKCWRKYWMPPVRLCACMCMLARLEGILQKQVVGFKSLSSLLSSAIQTTAWMPNSLFYWRKVSIYTFGMISIEFKIQRKKNFTEPWWVDELQKKLFLRLNRTFLDFSL